MLDTLIVSTAVIIIVSKFWDCLSTALYITHPDQESNPIARKWMERLGINTVIWGIFGLSVVLLSLVLYLLFTRYNTPYYKTIFILVGTLISLIQFSVAHTNTTKKLNFITRILLRIYSRR